jgi:anti-anti-sigma regulatory factor
MATITRATITLPVAGDDMLAAPLTDQITNILSFLEGTNIDVNNVDYSSSDGIVVMNQAQTLTGLKDLQVTSVAGSGVLQALQFGLNPSSGTPTANDGVRLAAYADDAGGTKSDIGFLDFVMTTATAGAEVSRFDVYVAAGAGAAVSQVQIGDGFFRPTTDSDVWHPDPRLRQHHRLQRCHLLRQRESFDDWDIGIRRTHSHRRSHSHHHVHGRE